MTANLIGKVVESLYEKVDIEKMSAELSDIKKYENGRITDAWFNTQIQEKSYHRWLEAIGLLEEYCRTNYATFQETELVYKWAKQICERRNREYNQWRCTAWYIPFEQWIKKR